MLNLSRTAEVCCIDLENDFDVAGKGADLENDLDVAGKGAGIGI